MKKLALSLALVAACLVGVGCKATGPETYESTNVVGAKVAEAHNSVFGCYPKGYVPPRVLEAEGPKEDTCGRPVYKRPACSECTDCQPPAIK